VKAIEIALKRPFPIAKLHWRRGQGGSGDLVYITARDVMDRLDEVFGVAGWQTKFEWVGGRMICQLSVRMEGEWITKSDGADDSQIEGAKGGISDSLKRAAVQYGIGRLYYHPGAFNSAKQPAKWATPEGYDEIMAAREGKAVEAWRAEYEVHYQDIRGPDTKRRK
tara:strand:+ start:289 stop:786 length:498 start_codon:yes stop_codon:yes gene_type:complete